MKNSMATPQSQARALYDNSILHSAQLSFIEEIEACGGSYIAASHAFRMKSGEMARRAGMLELMSFWQAADFDSEGKSDKNLPSFIALEDCIFALEENFGTLGQDADFQALRIGISRMKKNKIWSFENLGAFLRAGESLFAKCRDALGVTSVYCTYGLDALDRVSVRILKENPSIAEALYSYADDAIDQYFDHLSEGQIQRGEFNIAAISRGEGQSPAWICGKIIVMGLSRLSDPVLDPILDPEMRRKSHALMDMSSLSIAEEYAGEMNKLVMRKRTLEPGKRTSVRLRISAAMAGLRQLSEMTTTPRQIASILDHLDSALREAGAIAGALQAYSFAGRSRLHSAHQLANIK